MTSPGFPQVTWAVLSNQIIALLINMKMRIFFANFVGIPLSFHDKHMSCQSAVLASVYTDIHIIVFGRINRIRMHSSLTSRRFAWYINFNLKYESFDITVAMISD